MPLTGAYPLAAGFICCACDEDAASSRMETSSKDVKNGLL
jgi:hypothetical protein